MTFSEKVYIFHYESNIWTPKYNREKTKKEKVKENIYLLSHFLKQIALYLKSTCSPNIPACECLRYIIGGRLVWQLRVQSGVRLLELQSQLSTHQLCYLQQVAEYFLALLPSSIN